MSFCSSWVVAGRTMSAYLAVSVRKCSLTTVNRSSRSRPLLEFGLLGHHGHGVGVVDEQRLDRRIEAEFAGQRRPKPPLNSAHASFPAARSGRISISPFNRKGPDRKLKQTAADMLPGADQSGRQAIARTVWPPPACRSTATPMRTTAGGSGRVFPRQFENIVDRNAGLLRRRTQAYRSTPVPPVHRSRRCVCRCSRGRPGSP